MAVPWTICKMNMILHGIDDADIRQGDTIADPQHVDKGELKRFDRVIANPPFSQNYSKKEMNFKERFRYGFCPESGKKADLMFVQHMISALKENGRMAVIMPHGVLFRGGDEKHIREGIIKDGILEAVIGLPPGLFYGTGIPACVLIVNKENAKKRKSVLFINADRDYKEGKKQNQLRPEDIEKISYVYQNKRDVPKYARIVPVDEIFKEEVNLNIRRYVDNTPDPEPHDVKAHLLGGVPRAEVDSRKEWFDSHGLDVSLLFDSKDKAYYQFKSSLEDKGSLKQFIESHEAVTSKEAEMHKAMDSWWKKHKERLSNLPKTKDAFAIKNELLTSFGKGLEKVGMLDSFKSAGIFVSFWWEIAYDLKSIASSGFNAELIPDDEILQSQFPDKLEALRKQEERLQEIEALFAQADSGDDEEEDSYSMDRFETDPYPLAETDPYSLAETDPYSLAETDPYNLTETGPCYPLPKQLVKSLKAQVNEHNGKIKQLQWDTKESGKSHKAEISKLEQEIAAVEAKLSHHTDLENEQKKLRADIKAFKNLTDELVQKAKEQISPEQADKVILERFYALQEDTLKSYMKQHLMEIIKYLENLWDKYKVTAKEIEQERDLEAQKLDGFLKELGYV